MVMDDHSTQRRFLNAVSINCWLDMGFSDTGMMCSRNPLFFPPSIWKGLRTRWGGLLGRLALHTTMVGLITALA